MKFRFSVKRLVVPGGINVPACDGTLLPLKDVSLKLWLNGTLIWDTPDVENLGNLLPVITTVGTLGVITTTEDLEGVIVTEITGLEIWESATIDVEITRSGYNDYVNSYTIFGYDIGNSPTVNNNNGDPIDYNPEMTIVLVPTTVGLTQAVGSNGVNNIITATAYGSAGNGLTIVGDGVTTLALLVNAFNLANPNNTIFITDFAYTLLVLGNGVTVTTAGGTDEPYTYPYTIVTGWSAPFTNKQYYYNMSSSNGRSVFLNSDNVQVGLGRSAIVCCSDLPVRIKQTTYATSVLCGCANQTVIGECESEAVFAKLYNLKPVYFAAIACESCCETENDCIIVEGDNNINVSIDTTTLSTMFVHDDDVIGTGTIELLYELYNSAGLVVSAGTFEYDYSTGILPNWVIELPERGNYILLFKVGISDVFMCQTAYKYIGCHQYHIEQVTCNKFRVYNYSSINVQLRLFKLNSDKQFIVDRIVSIAACTYVDVEVVNDGVYNFNVGPFNEKNMIVVVDCNLRACYLNYLNKLACNGVSKCTCGGRCANGCSAIPFDLYNFNAFMALTYAYFSLLNEEYIDHYIYNGIEGDETDFTTHDIERFYNIHQLLERALEYCSVCKDVKDNSGCVTCK